MHSPSRSTHVRTATTRRHGRRAARARRLHAKARPALRWHGSQADHWLPRSTRRLTTAVSVHLLDASVRVHQPAYLARPSLGLPCQPIM